MKYLFRFGSELDWIIDVSPQPWNDLITTLAHGDEADGSFLYVKRLRSKNLLCAGDPSILLVQIADAIMKDNFPYLDISMLNYRAACCKPVWMIPCSRLWWALDEISMKKPEYHRKIVKETEHMIVSYLHGGDYD
jgi:hypothetical protein